MIEDLRAYTLDRFIPFTAETYARLFERQHAALWPAQPFLILLALAALILACRGRRLGAAALLALSLATVAATFHFRLYADLTPVGRIFGWAFLLESGLVLAWGLVARREPAPRRTPSFWIGLGLFVLGVAIYPLLAPWSGHSWSRALVFGLAPDPTVCATLGLLLIAGRPLWLIAVLPVLLLWCGASAATLHVLEAKHPLLIATAGAAALAAALIRRRSRDDGKGPPSVTP